MKTKTLQQIASAIDAELIASDRSTVISSICTDTRSITPGCLFIAIKGENHDGHDHLQAARAGGAAAVMVHRDVPIDLPRIVVDDTRKAMGRLANYVRHLLQGKVIAVAGSNGKTGTKNLIHSVLKDSLAGTISPKSFNNDVGVPTTIFDAVPSDDYLVLEIGTNHHGEILNLTTIAEPDVAIITNIGAEHLEFLGDLEGVTRENAQIISGLNPDGLLIINGDHAPLLKAVENYRGKITTFGFGEHNDLHPIDIRCDADGVRFRIKMPRPITQPRHAGNAASADEIFIPLLGRHTAVNALAAIAVGRHLGLDDAAIVSALARATGPEMRLQLQLAGSVRILNDAYNANPHSMQAGLTTLKEMPTTGRRVAILGDMRELGTTSERYHQQIGQFAADCDIDELICVGPHAGTIATAAAEGGFPTDCITRFTTSADCAAKVATLIHQDDLVLLKGSRGMKLETIATAIQSAATADALRRQVTARTRRVLKTPQPASVNTTT